MSAGGLHSISSEGGVCSTLQGDALVLALVGSTDEEIDGYLERQFTDRQLAQLDEAATLVAERAYIVRRRRAARS